MPLRGLAFLAFYCSCALGALFAPHLGVYGYVGTYCIGPENEWWSVPFRHWGIRFSLFAAMATAAGTLLHWRRLKWGDRFLETQEVWFWVFIGAVWLSVLIGEPTIGRYGSTDHPSVKMLKIAVFLFLYAHLITDLKKLDGLLWLFVGCSLFLGIEAWETPWRAFQSGRLERIGGADFAEANFFAAFMAAMVPIIGLQFLRSGWKGKLFTAIAGAFTVNAVILCRSRGAFVALVAGALAAAAYAPKRHRKKVYAALVLGILGGIRLADPQFIERALTVTKPVAGQRLDESAASRPRLWGAGVEMVLDQPFGIGAGNWYQTIGRYIPEYVGKDSHSTYVKALAETGVLGGLSLLLVIFSGYRATRAVGRAAEEIGGELGDELRQMVFGITLSCVVLLIAAVFITMIYTETLWLILFLPTLLLRACKNALAAHAAENGLSMAAAERPAPGLGRGAGPGKAWTPGHPTVP